MRKHYHSKKSFSNEIYARTLKATHKVSQQRGASSIREFSIFHNLQFFAWKLWLKIGCLELGMRLQIGIDFNEMLIYFS